MLVRLAVLGAAIAVAPLAALAQAKAQAHSFRCVTKDGKKYYGSTIPRQCIGQPVEAMSASGRVLYRVDADADDKAREAKEAEAAKKRVEDARGRALADNAKLVREVEGRMEAIRKRQAGYAKEMEFYSDSPKPGGKAKSSAKPPAKLLEDMRTAEVDLKLQQEALESRKKEVGTINAKYDEDRKRYLALTRRK